MEIESIGSDLDPIKRRLLQLSKSRSGEVRMRAIEAMAALHGSEVEARVTTALKDPDELVRVAALEVIACWKQPLANGSMSASLRDKDELVRSAAAVALGQIGAQKAVADLEKRLRVAGDEEQVGVLYALYKLGQKQALSKFLNGLNHAFYRVRCATANLSCSLVDESNRTRVIRHLREALARESTRAARSSIEYALSKIRRGL